MYVNTAPGIKPNGLFPLFMTSLICDEDILIEGDL